MVIKTIEHIHNLLIEAVEVAELTKKGTLKALQDAEADGKDTRSLQEIYSSAYEAWKRANAALMDFEEEEW